MRGLGVMGNFYLPIAVEKDRIVRDNRMVCFETDPPRVETDAWA